MSDLLVILGAGASHDGLRPGSEAPPLAANLFHPAYDRIQQMFTGVDGLRDNIIAEMQRGRGLEEILGELSKSEDRNVRRHVFEIPVYLKVLLGQFNSGGRACTYDTLITHIQRRSLSVTFVTLNYDTLLDKAIERKYAATIESMDDFVSGVNVSGWNYIKLHGSVNWGYPLWDNTTGMVPLTHDYISAYLSGLDYREQDVPRNPSRISLLASERVLSADNVLVYPALAIPTDQKNEIVCPPEHVKVLQSALRSDPAILVVGNQGLDSDLMAILGGSGRPRSSKPFYIVEPEDGMAVAMRFADALQGRGFAPPRDGFGFRDFVESADAERFMNEVASWSR